MKIYIAAPLFNEMEIARNNGMRSFLNELGFETYLPQEDGGISYELINSGESSKEVREKIFQKDIQELKDFQEHYKKLFQRIQEKPKEFFISEDGELCEEMVTEDGQWIN